MTTTPWAHLPNAKHIDRILTGLKLRSETWIAAWDSTVYSTANQADIEGARQAARDATQDAVQAREATLYAVWDEIDSALDSKAWTAATDATDALIAWDDCAYILDLHPNVVRLMAASGNQPAILLEAAVIAMHEENV